MPTAKVTWQDSRVIVDHPSWQLDVLITASDRTPVVIEIEYAPGRDVENEAKQRLRHRVVDEVHPIETAFAVRYPQAVADAEDVGKMLESADLEFCIHYDDCSRFPERGWVVGSVKDIADLGSLLRHRL